MSVDDQELKKLIRDGILKDFYPEMIDIDPKVERQPSESMLRAFRRRGALRAEEVEALPMERQATYRLDATNDQPFERTVVIITDDNGNAKFILESK